MTNGQINAVPVLPVMSSSAQDTAVATINDGGQQSGGNFAEMLSEVQKTKVLPDSGQTKQPLESSTENLVVGLQAVLSGLSQLASTLEPVVVKQDDAEKAEAGNNDTPLRSDLNDITNQMVLSAYLQPGRMPDVNNLTEFAVDTLQKVAVAQEQSIAISAAAIENPTGQALVERQADAAKSLQPVKSDRMLDINGMTTLPAETTQKVAAVSEKTEIISAPSSTPQPLESDRMSDTNSMTALPVGTPQKVVAVPVKPELVAVLQGKNKEEPIILQDAKDDHNVTSGKNLSATLISSLPVPSPESELEIQMSQPQPITARLAAAAAAVSAGNQSIAVAQGPPAVMPEQQLEKVRTVNELNSAKEVTSALKTTESAVESILGSGTSQGGEGDQGQPNSASDNQTLTQDMRAQLGAEHQKISALSTKAAVGEIIRQDIPEQVIQQVKERLVQHDVKSGSQQITLTLSPDSLGELKMNLNLQGQKLSVEIVAENRSVRDIIVQHTEALKESLARQNITMESFDVTTGGKGSGNQGQNQNAWRELAKQQQQSWISPRGYQVARADLPSGHAGGQRQQGQSMLDIHY